jgi:hypothetical protein
MHGIYIAQSINWGGGVMRIKQMQGFAVKSGI